MFLGLEVGDLAYVVGDGVEKRSRDVAIGERGVGSFCMAAFAIGCGMGMRVTGRIFGIAIGEAIRQTVRRRFGLTFSLLFQLEYLSERTGNRGALQPDLSVVCTVDIPH